MCLSIVYTKEEFEEEFGEVPKYGWKIFDFDPKTEEITPFFYHEAGIPIPRKVEIDEKPYREDKDRETITSATKKSVKVEYPTGFHIFLYEEDAEAVCSFHDGQSNTHTILPIKLGKILAYGIEWKFCDNGTRSVVVCKTMTVEEKLCV